MGKKKRTNNGKTFAQIQKDLVPKVLVEPNIDNVEPKIDVQIEQKVNETVEAQYFRWCFIPDEMRWGDNFGFKNYKKDLQKFLIEIEQKIYDKYHNFTWHQVNNMPHCGFYKEHLNARQQEIACSLHKPDDEQLYHIHITQKHVLFGYRLDGVFHITINDPEHKFNDL